MANTFKFGNGQWATQEGLALAYNDENDNYKPLPFDFTRASSATRVNKQGFIETVASGLPRIDYLNNTNGALLLEPSSTNIVTFSEDFSQSYWTKSDTSINVNQSTSPDGTLNAASIVSSTTNSVHYLRHSYVAVSALTPYTYSFFIKPNGYTKFGVRDNAQTGANLTYNLETESVIHSASMTIVVDKLKNNWFKCSVTSTIGSNGVAGYALYLLDDGYGTPPNAGDPNNYSYTGDGVSGFYIYGFQLEQQSYPTSYIPTSGSAVTRAAETCNNAGNEQVINSTEGVLYAEIAAFENPTTSALDISISNGATTNYVRLEYYTDGKIYGTIYDGSFAASSTTVTQTNFNKIAVQWKSSGSKFALNGVITDFTGKTFSANTLNVVQFAAGNATSAIFYGKVKGLAVYNEALTDAELIALTS